MKKRLPSLVSGYGDHLRVLFVVITMGSAPLGWGIVTVWPLGSARNKLCICVMQKFEYVRGTPNICSGHPHQVSVMIVNTATRVDPIRCFVLGDFFKSRISLFLSYPRRGDGGRMVGEGRREDGGRRTAGGWRKKEGARRMVEEHV
jgi:hypothetical protein